MPPTSPLRLFWFSHSPHDGGAERMMADWIRALPPQVAVTAAIARGERSAMWDNVPATKVVVPAGYWMRRPGITTKAFYGLFAKDALLFLPWMIRAMRAARPDIVVTNTNASPGAAIAARLLGIPHVWYLHESLAEGTSKAGLLGSRMTLKAIGALSEAVVINSDYLRTEFAPTIAASKLRLIQPLIGSTGRPRRSSPPDAVPFRLVQVGALTAQKRQADTIRALALAVARGTDAVLDIVGPGSEAARLELARIAEEMGIAARVHFAGPVPSADVAFEHAHLAAVPSLSEGLGRVTIEAMQRGIPVLGARSGETANIVTRSGGGVLFEPRDVDSMATVVGELASDRARLGRLSAAGRTYVLSAYDPATAVEAMVGLLHEVQRQGRSANGHAL